MLFNHVGFVKRTSRHKSKTHTQTPLTPNDNPETIQIQKQNQ